MKITTAIICLLMLSATSTVAAQNEQHGFQWGAEARAEWFNANNSMVTANALLGYRFNRRYYLGGIVGVGKGTSSYSEVPDDANYVCVPVLVDFTRFYPMGKTRRNSFFLGAEVGAVAHYNSKPIVSQTFYSTEVLEAKGLDAAPYVGVNCGFDFAVGKPHIFVGAQLNFVGAGVRAGLRF